MAWIKVDVRAGSDPRLLRAGRPAKALWLEFSCYAGMYLTDGHIPPEVVAPKDQPLVDKLLAAGLLAPSPDGNGYLLTGYLELNSERAYVMKVREDKARRMAEKRSHEEHPVTSNKLVTFKEEGRRKKQEVYKLEDQSAEGRRFALPPEVAALVGKLDQDPRPKDPDEFLKWVHRQGKG